MFFYFRVCVVDPYYPKSGQVLNTRHACYPDPVCRLVFPRLDADSKARLYRERYTALYQRTSRHKLFTPTVVVGGGTVGQEDGEPEKKYQLKTIDFLLVIITY